MTIYALYHSQTTNYRTMKKIFRILSLLLTGQWLVEAFVIGKTHYQIRELYDGTFSLLSDHEGELLVGQELTYDPNTNHLTQILRLDPHVEESIRYPATRIVFQLTEDGPLEISQEDISTYRSIHPSPLQGSWLGS